MLNQPTSSPMMKTMFGFFPDELGAALALAVSAPACASLTFLATPPGWRDGSSTPWPVAPVPAPACRVAGVGPSARDEGLKPFVAAMKPSIVPSPTQANA